MTAYADWALNFLLRIFAVPELSAILTSLAVGLALTYLSQLAMPKNMEVLSAKRWGTAIIFVVVIVVAVAMRPTPRVALWALTNAAFIPKTYEWLQGWLFAHYPWLKPKALQTQAELDQHALDKSMSQ
jgi:hypothetical protein